MAQTKEEKNRHQREVYRKRSEDGICTKCGKNPAAPGKKRCQGCLDKNNARGVEEYAYFKSKGICVQCHKERVAENSVQCPNCLEEKAQRTYDYLHRMPEDKKKEMSKRWGGQRKAKREDRKKNGLCTVCGSPAYKDHLMCYDHVLEHRRRYRESKDKRGAYRKEGECIRCGAPVVEGKKLCRVHYDQACKNLQPNPEVVRERVNEIWRGIINKKGVRV